MAWCSWFALSLLAGCMSGPDRTPVEGHAFLTIVGSSQVTVGGTTRETLTVRYHDDLDRPLVGEVGFDIVGDPRGGDLSTVTTNTDDDGEATVDILPGTQATFQVKAVATYATPVTWSVAVGPGGTSLDATGVYQVTSQFDLAGDMPESFARISAELHDMIDSENDPGTWILDRMLPQLNDPAVASVIGGLRPGFDYVLNYQLERNTPGLLDSMKRLVADFDNVAKQFGASSRITVTRNADGSLQANHDVGAWSCNVEGASHVIGLDKLLLTGSSATAVPVVLRGKTRISFARHSLPFAYGHFLRYVLDELIVPQFQADAEDLGEVFTTLINCNRAGTVISTRIGGDGAILGYESACRTVITNATDAMEQELEAATVQAVFGLTGYAKPDDLDGDGRIDHLSEGHWQGTLGFADGAATLAPTQSFSALRQ